MRKSLASMLLRSRSVHLAHVGDLYDRKSDPDEIAIIQKNRFNKHWAYAWGKVPFYTDWRSRHKLPARIDSISDLCEFPILTKSELSNKRDLIQKTPYIERYTRTGGTSGIATAFPMNKFDARSSWSNTHLGRRWNGIEPGDKLFMIWGHSHLFAGPGGKLQHAKRKLKDWAANIDRVSAYNLSSVELELIASNILRSKPVYLIAYGSCLGQLCNYLKDQNRDFRDLGVKRIVNTSETILSEDADLVESVFHCPVINEYGMAEAGVIGYSKGNLYPVDIFWSDFAIRLADQRIILTTLGDRCFPLINYDTEDLGTSKNIKSGMVVRLDSLLGKARDIFSVKDIDGDSQNVSVILFDHILKQIPQLRSLHYTLTASLRIRVEYTAEGDVPTESTLRNYFLSGLFKEGINLKPTDIEFHRLKNPLQTKAGKRLKMKREIDES